jgi:hypothetical protein
LQDRQLIRSGPRQNCREWNRNQFSGNSEPWLHGFGGGPFPKVTNLIDRLSEKNNHSDWIFSLCQIDPEQ